MAKNVAKLGIFVALAMVFSYIEVFIPFHIGIPGVKLGIANIVVVTALYILKGTEVWMISMVRILLMGLLFGNGASLLYSLAGGILSLAVMMLLKKTKKFSIMGVSVAGGVFHNMGQLFAAAFVIQNGRVLYYFAVLGISGVITGFLIGLIAGQVVRVMKQLE